MHASGRDREKEEEEAVEKKARGGKRPTPVFRKCTMLVSDFFPEWRSYLICGGVVPVLVVVVAVVFRIGGFAVWKVKIRTNY